MRAFFSNTHRPQRVSRHASAHREPWEPYKLWHSDTEIIKDAFLSRRWLLCKRLDFVQMSVFLGMATVCLVYSCWLSFYTVTAKEQFKGTWEEKRKMSATDSLFSNFNSIKKKKKKNPCDNCIEVDCSKMTEHMECLADNTWLRSK